MKLLEFDTEEPGVPNSPAEKISDMMDKQLQSGVEGWNYNNSVVVLITSKYADSSRVYVGLMKRDPNDPEEKDIPTHVIDKAGFKRISSYVPMSFDGGERAREIIKQELVKAMEELNKTGQNEIAKSLSDFNE